MEFGLCERELERCRGNRDLKPTGRVERGVPRNVRERAQRHLAMATAGGLALGGLKQRASETTARKVWIYRQLFQVALAVVFDHVGEADEVAAFFGDQEKPWHLEPNGSVFGFQRFGGTERLEQRNVSPFLDVFDRLSVGGVGEADDEICEQICCAGGEISHERCG